MAERLKGAAQAYLRRFCNTGLTGQSSFDRAVPQLRPSCGRAQPELFRVKVPSELQHRKRILKLEICVQSRQVPSFEVQVREPCPHMRRA